MTFDKDTSSNQNNADFLIDQIEAIINKFEIITADIKDRDIAIAYLNMAIETLKQNY